MSQTLTKVWTVHNIIGTFVVVIVVCLFVNIVPFVYSFSSCVDMFS